MSSALLLATAAASLAVVRIALRADRV